MFRMVLGLSSVAILVLSAAGCTMCCHPYDNSGPVFSDGGCQASTHSRAGSILAGSPEPSVVLANDPIHRKPVSQSPTPDQAKRQLPSMSYVMTGRQAERSSPTPLAKKPQEPFSYTMAGNRPEGPLLGSAQPGDVPGSERIVSITDRAVGPSADSSQAAAEASPAPARPLPPSRWTARRPTTELLR